MAELRITGQLKIGEIKKSFKTNWDVMFYIDKKHRSNTKRKDNDKLNLRQLFEKGEWLTKLVLPEFLQRKMGENFILINDNKNVGQVKKSFKDAGFEVSVPFSAERLSPNFSVVPLTSRIPLLPKVPPW